jgi:hypothetical protein
LLGAVLYEMLTGQRAFEEEPTQRGIGDSRRELTPSIPLSLCTFPALIMPFADAWPKIRNSVGNRT